MPNLPRVRNDMRDRAVKTIKTLGKAFYTLCTPEPGTIGPRVAGMCSTPQSYLGLKVFTGKFSRVVSYVPIDECFVTRFGKLLVRNFRIVRPDGAEKIETAPLHARGVPHGCPMHESFDAFLNDAKRLAGASSTFVEYDSMVDAAIAAANDRQVVAPETPRDPTKPVTTIKDGVTLLGAICSRFGFWLPNEFAANLELTLKGFRQDKVQVAASPLRFDGMFVHVKGVAYCVARLTPVEKVELAKHLDQITDASGEQMLNVNFRLPSDWSDCDANEGDDRDFMQLRDGIQCARTLFSDLLIRGDLNEFLALADHITCETPLPEEIATAKAKLAAFLDFAFPDVHVAVDRLTQILTDYRFVIYNDFVTIFSEMVVDALADGRDIMTIASLWFLRDLSAHLAARHAAPKRAM